MDFQTAQNLANQYFADKEAEKSEVSLFKDVLSRRVTRLLAKQEGLVWKSLCDEEKKEFCRRARRGVAKLNRAMDSKPGEERGLLTMKTMRWSAEDYGRFCAGLDGAQALAKAAHGMQETYLDRLEACRKYGVHPLSEDADRIGNFIKEWSTLLPGERLDVITRAETEVGKGLFRMFRADVQERASLYEKEKDSIVLGKEDRIFNRIEALDEVYRNLDKDDTFKKSSVTQLSKDAFKVLRDVYVGMLEGKGVSLAKLARLSPSKAAEYKKKVRARKALSLFTEAAGKHAAKGKKLN